MNKTSEKCKTCNKVPLIRIKVDNAVLTPEMIETIQQAIERFAPIRTIVFSEPIQEIEILEGLNDPFLKLLFWINWDLRRHLQIDYNYAKENGKPDRKDGVTDAIVSIIDYFKKLLSLETDENGE